MPAALAPRKLRPAFVAQSVLMGSAIAVYLLVLGSAGHQDLDPYLAAGRHVWNGEPLYATFLQHPFPDPTLRPAFIYPPAFALLIAPLALLPGAMANLVWLIVGQVSLAAAMLLVLRWLRPPSWAVATLVVATLTFYPLWIDVQQGQANLLVLLLVTAGIAGVALVAFCCWRGSRRPAMVRAAPCLPRLPLLSSVPGGHPLVILRPVIWLSFFALAEGGWPFAPAVTLGGLLLMFSVVSRWPAGPAFNQPGFRLAQTTDPMVFMVANTLFFATFILFLAAPWLLRSR